MNRWMACVSRRTAQRYATAICLGATGLLALAGCGSSGHGSGTATPTASTSAASSATNSAPAAGTTQTVPASAYQPQTQTTQSIPGVTPAPSSQGGRAGLRRYLLQNGEEQNFTIAAGGGTFPNLNIWVKFTGLTKADKKILASEGFIAAAQENIGDSQNDGGASFVEEFKTASGARHEAATDARQATQGGFKVSFFVVDGLPNSHGALISQSGEAGTDLYWTEGRCTLWIGNGSTGPLEPQVVAAARSIYARTQGKCP